MMIIERKGFLNKKRLTVGQEGGNMMRTRIMMILTGMIKRKMRKENEEEEKKD